jgi:hypothetical protein
VTADQLDVAPVPGKDIFQFAGNVAEEELPILPKFSVIIVLLGNPNLSTCVFVNDEQKTDNNDRCLMSDC